MEKPWVTIICLCYNQSRFVEETLASVFTQTYPMIQVIVVDDGSIDNSVEVIERYLKDKPEVVFLDLKKNVGNTTAFNKGFQLAKGKYVIDLACDDILELDRVERQIEFFETQPENVGMIYSDAIYISETGIELDRHFSNSRRISFEGEVYEKVISEYFIPPPTMMMKKEVLTQLGGYDENLAYEDFDFWVRSSRNWHFAFQNEITTKIRRVTTSLSHQLYQPNDRQLRSTIKICEKIFEMNKNDAENKALIKRLKYEITHAFLTGHKKEVKSFIQLHEKIAPLNWQFKVVKLINPLGINWSPIRRWIMKLTKITLR